MSRALALAAALAALTTAAADAKPTRHQRAVADALAYAGRHPGFDTYTVRCGPRHCRWWLDDLDLGRTCSSRTGHRVRCSRWRVPQPDPAPTTGSAVVA
jgi:hypothetical protein